VLIFGRNDDLHLSSIIFQILRSIVHISANYSDFDQLMVRIFDTALEFSGSPLLHSESFDSLNALFCEILSLQSNIYTFEFIFQHLLKRAENISSKDSLSSLSGIIVNLATSKTIHQTQLIEYFLNCLYSEENSVSFERENAVS
jgi:hypothetical protein